MPYYIARNVNLTHFKTYLENFDSKESKFSIISHKLLSDTKQHLQQLCPIGDRIILVTYSESSRKISFAFRIICLSSAC